MNKSTYISSYKIFVSINIILSFGLIFFASASGRPFDWHYNYLSTPFTVFYNPSLIGNNAGYTLGVDGRYVDDNNYDARLALVIPISGIATYEDHISDRALRKNHASLKYPYHSHKSSSSAISVGGIYRSDESYNIAAGFTTPLEHIQMGASMNFISGDDRPLVSMSMGLNASFSENSVHATFHNFLVNDRGADNLFGISVGAAGAAYSDPYTVTIPIEGSAAFFIDDGEVSRAELGIRVSVDFTPLLIGRERTGMTAALSGGYTRIENIPDEIKNDNRFFAALGIVFMGRERSASVFGAHDFDCGNYGAFIYNSFREGSAGMFAGNKFVVGLRQSKTADGQIMFHIDCRRNNIVSWVLRIDSGNGESVRTFSGGNAIPSTILWDKVSSTGDPVPSENVRAKLVVKSFGGVVAESDWILID